MGNSILKEIDKGLLIFSENRLEPKQMQLNPQDAKNIETYKGIPVSADHSIVLGTVYISQ